MDTTLFERPMTPFYRFPLCALGIKTSPRTLVESLLVWCCRDVGRKRAEKHGLNAQALREAVRSHLVREWALHPAYTFEEAQLFLGAHILTVDLSGRKLEDLTKSTFTLDHTFWTAGGAENLNTVTMTSTRFWQGLLGICNEAEDEPLEPGEMTWNEWRVMAAILSKIGDKGFATCGWQEIRARAAGIVGKAALELATSGQHQRDQMGALLLSRKQIRRLTDRLVNQMKINRVTLPPKTWFSVSKTREELQQAVLAKRKATLDRLTRASRQREEDAAFFAQHLPTPNKKPQAPSTAPPGLIVGHFSPKGGAKARAHGGANINQRSSRSREA